MKEKDSPCIINLAAIYPNKSMTDLKELEEYVRKIQVANPSRADLRIKIKDYTNEKGKELKSKYLNILDTLGKGAINIDRMNNPRWIADPKQAALSFFEETSSVVGGAGINVERITQVKQKQFLGKFMSNLEKTGNRDIWEKSAFDREIREYIRDGKLSGSAKDKTVKLVGDLVKNQYLIMHKEVNAAGIALEYRKDYDGPVVHNKLEIFGKFDKWVTKLTDSLDYAAEFPILSSADISEFELLKQSGKITLTHKNPVIKILKGAYDNIVEGIENPLLSENKYISIAERRAKAKTFTKWKSGNTLQDYLTEFGKYKTLAEQYNYYAMSTARDVGLVSVLGASPTKGYAIIKAELTRALKVQGKTGFELDKELKDVDIAYRNLVENRAFNPNIIGKIFITQRHAAALAKLGWSGATSFFLDPQSMANQRRIMYNEGLIKSVLATYGHYAGAIKDAVLLKDVEERYLFNQYQLSSTFEELYEMAQGKNWMSLASEMVAKGSGSYFANKVSHIASAKMWLKFLADGHKGKKLSQTTLADLGKFGISLKDLDVVSKLDAGEYGMVNVNNLNAIEYADITKTDMGEEDLEISVIEFKQRINAWLLERIMKSAPIPGNRERRKLYGDTVAGTLEGEGRRYLGQFKSTALKQMTDMTVGGLRSKNPNADQTGFKVYDKKTTAFYVGRMTSAFTLSGLIYMFLGAIIRRDEEAIQRFLDGDPSLIIEGFARGGGGFLLNDMVKMNANYLYNIGQLASPAIAAAVKHPANIGKAIGGDPAGAIISELKTNLPGANMIWLTPFMEGFDDGVKEKTRFKSKDYLD